MGPSSITDGVDRNRCGDVVDCSDGEIEEVTNSDGAFNEIGAVELGQEDTAELDDLAELDRDDVAELDRVDLAEELDTGDPAELDTGDPADTGDSAELNTDDPAELDQGDRVFKVVLGSGNLGTDAVVIEDLNCVVGGLLNSAVVNGCVEPNNL